MISFHELRFFSDFRLPTKWPPKTKSATKDNRPKHTLKITLDKNLKIKKSSLTSKWCRICLTWRITWRTCSTRWVAGPSIRRRPLSLGAWSVDSFGNVRKRMSTWTEEPSGWKIFKHYHFLLANQKNAYRFPRIQFSTTADFAKTIQNTTKACLKISKVSPKIFLKI